MRGPGSVVRPERNAAGGTGFPRRIDGHSLSRRLTVSIIMTMVVVSTVTVLLGYVDASRKARVQLAMKADDYLASLVSILEIPLWTFDDAMLPDIGDFYARNELIVELKFIDSLGEVRFQVGKQNNAARVRRTAEIRHQGEYVGRVELALTSSFYEEYTLQLLWSVILAIGINLLVLVIITGFLLRLYLRKPLLQLGAIVDVYASGNYRVPKVQVPYAEFQPLLTVLGEMGGKITLQLEELRQAERRYREIFENAVEGIFQISPAGRILNANPAMARILGYADPGELLAGITDIVGQLFVRPEDNRTFERLMREQGSVSRIEAQLQRRDGSRFWASVSARIVAESDGQISCYEGSMVDITEQKEREQAQRQRRAAEDANLAKSQFLARMSHEIRTPLNAILGMTEMLAETELSARQRDWIETLGSSGDLLLTIVNQILDFSKIEAQQLKLEVTPFILPDLIDEVHAMMAVKGRAKGLELSCRIHPDLPILLLGDPTRLRQILINLLDNAIKFTVVGKVTLEIGPGEDGPDREQLLFRVQDSGIGIPTGQHQSIFASFSQADSSCTRRFGGTGLGLSICKCLVELMDGRIWVESDPGRGASFFFTACFIRPGENPLAVSDPEQAADSVFANLPSPMRILLVEDVDPNRKLIHSYLEELPVAIEDAENGIAAMELFCLGTYDLVLMDVEMPLQDGIATTICIRQWERENKLPATPIVMLTAHAIGEQRQRCFEAGCDAFLVKPIRRRELLAVLRDFPAGDAVEQHSDALDRSAEGETGGRGHRVRIDAELEELLPGFFAYASGSLQTMKQALCIQDFTELFRLGHGLKGSARNYQLLELAEIFLQIEESAKEEDAASIWPQLEAVKGYLERVEVEFVGEVSLGGG